MLSKPITLHSGSSFKILLHKLDPINLDAPVTKIILFLLTCHSFPLRFKAHIGIKMCNELCFYFLTFICYHVLEVRSTLQSTVRRVADFCISFRLNQHTNQCKFEYFKHTLVLTSSPQINH